MPSRLLATWTLSGQAVIHSYWMSQAKWYFTCSLEVTGTRYVIVNSQSSYSVKVLAFRSRWIISPFLNRNVLQSQYYGHYLMSSFKGVHRILEGQVHFMLWTIQNHVSFQMVIFSDEVACNEHQHYFRERRSWNKNIHHIYLSTNCFYSVWGIWNVFLWLYMIILKANVNVFNL